MISIAELGALPSDPSAVRLEKGKVYTVVVRIPSWWAPSEEKVRNAISNSVFGAGFMDVVSVSNPWFTDDYLVIFRSKRNITLDRFLSLYKFNPPIQGSYIVDFKSGSIERPGLVKRIAEVAKPVTGVVSDIRTIFVIGLIAFAAWQLAPAIRALVVTRGRL